MNIHWNCLFPTYVLSLFVFTRSSYWPTRKYNCHRIGDLYPIGSWIWTVLQKGISVLPLETHKGFFWRLFRWYTHKSRQQKSVITSNRYVNYFFFLSKVTIHKSPQLQWIFLLFFFKTVSANGILSKIPCILSDDNKLELKDPIFSKPIKSVLRKQIRSQWICPGSVNLVNLEVVFYTQLSLWWLQL